MLEELDNNIGIDQEISDADIIPNELLFCTALPALEFECSLNSHVVQITHIESPSDFYVMLEEKVEYFKMFSDNINDFYANEKFPPSVIEIPVGSTWCVLVNGSWMRADVISNLGRLKPDQDDKPVPYYQVFLVDKGSTMTTSLNNVRYLDSQFTLDPPMAIPCLLSDVYPLSQLEGCSWTPDAVEVFTEFCSHSVLTAILWSKKLSLHYNVILEMMSDEVLAKPDPTINELLVFSGYATSTYLGVVVEDADVVLENVDNTYECSNSGTSKDELHNLVSSKADDSNTEDGQNDANGEEAPEKSFSEWNPMVEHQQEAETLMNDIDPERYFLGYKNEDAKNICAYIRYNRPCPRGDQCKYLHIVPRDDGLPSGSEEVYTNLTCQPLQPEEGKMYRAMVLSASSPTMFCCLFEIDDIGGMEVLNELQEDLTEAYKQQPLKDCQTTPAIGELMVLHNKEGDMTGYYRVRVIELSQRELGVMVQVYYIDYGTEEWVKECQLRSIFSCFLNVPAQAVECYLFDVYPNGNSSWTDEAMDCFNRLVDDKYANVTVLSADNAATRFGIELEYNEGTRILVNSTLVMNGYAKCEEV